MSSRPDEPTWLPRLAVEAAHADQLREHGGEHGLRDKGLLASALTRPRRRWSCDPDSDLADLAAAEGSLEESGLAGWIRWVMVAAGE